MPIWADLNERQQQYLLPIYETDQEQEADERGMWKRGGTPRPASLWRWMEYGVFDGIGSTLYTKLHLRKLIDEGCYPPVSVFHQSSRLHACSSVKHAATFPLFWLLLIYVSIVIQVWLVTWREQQGQTEPVEERLIPPWEYGRAS